ncbi:MAG: hypothetical protein H0A76_08835 [Candidatus Thiodubiliella endoseptemdiera]|uniref:Uncharacterized protein n=1 Tax=Candidatus Thiodubiliella endoseptemdiera TaxID=2738886 RepID=A0A853F367_9GAMM|nr:hypothetical protein [Candidatus Thiodubiliella endoseptemdiera]
MTRFDLVKGDGVFSTNVRFVFKISEVDEVTAFVITSMIKISAKGDGFVSAAWASVAFILMRLMLYLA